MGREVPHGGYGFFIADERRGVPAAGARLMAAPSEVVRVEAALKNHGVKELEWARWYCAMRQRVPSARPADLKFWGAMAERVEAALAPAAAAKTYPAKKKRADRGLSGTPPDTREDPAGG